MRKIPKVIFFDFFGVICDHISSKWINEECTNEQKTKMQKAFERGNTGEIKLSDIYTMLSTETGKNEGEIKEDWEKSVKINWELIEYIKELKNQHCVCILSNALPTFEEKILKDYKLRQYFDYVFISSAVGKKKPDVSFYEHALKSIGIDGEYVIMIDDMPENIEAAKSVGMDGILYENLEQMKEELQKKIEEETEE